MRERLSGKLNKAVRQAAGSEARTQHGKSLIAPGLAGEKSDFFSILLGVGCGAREEKKEDSMERT